MSAGEKGRGTRIAIAAALAAGVFLAPAAGAATGRRPSPQKFVAASILVHNGFADEVQDQFAGPNSYYVGELKRCHEVEAESGELREGEEKSLRQDAPNNISSAESLRSFNSRLPLWVRTFEGFRPRLRRADRGKLLGAVKRLAAAHAAHEQEFFDLKGVWVQIESVNCATAAERKQEADEVGTHAWTKEFRALVEVAHLFKVKRPPVNYPVGPYVQEPVG